MILRPRRTRITQFSLSTLLVSVTVAAAVLGTMLAWPAWREYLVVQEFRKAVLEATTPTERAEAFAELAKRVKPSSLRRLQQDDDVGLALLAAYWLCVEREERRYRLSGKRVEAFVASLKERTGLDVPDWWAGSVIASRSTVPVSVASGATMMRRAGENVILTGGERIIVPQEVYDSRDQHSWDTYAATIGPNHGYVYIAREGGRSSTLFCVNADSPIIRWQTTVWALGTYGGRGGSRDYAAELTLEDDLVVAWGTTGSESCVEAFDVQTGENIFRFCTANRAWSMNWMRSRLR